MYICMNEHVRTSELGVVRVGHKNRAEFVSMSQESTTYIHTYIHSIWALPIICPRFFGISYHAWSVGCPREASPPEVMVISLRTRDKSRNIDRRIYIHTA